jgi:hypothetical protein
MYIMKKTVGEDPIYYNCRSFFSNLDMAAAALGVYVFTGVDTVEGFLSIGKTTPMKRLLKTNNMTYMNIIQSLGDAEELSDEMLSQLQLFAIRVVFNE